MRLRRGPGIRPPPPVGGPVRESAPGLAGRVLPAAAGVLLVWLAAACVPDERDAGEASRGQGGVPAASATADRPPTATAGSGSAELSALLDGGAYAEAEARAREELARLEANGAGRSLEAAEVHDVLVVALTRGGKASEPDAAASAEAAIEIKEERLGSEHPALARSLDNAGVLFFLRGAYHHARPLYERAQAVLEVAGINDAAPRVELGIVHSHLGPLFQELGDYSSAREHYRGALDLFSSALGTDDRRVAMSQNNLATLLVKLGDYGEAAALYGASLASLEAQLGAEHPLIATSKHNHAELSQRMGRVEQAAALYEEARRVKERTLGPEHPSLALTLGNLSVLYTDRGEPGPAADLASRALEIQEAAYGPEHVDLAYSLVALGRAQAARGDPLGARQTLERAVALRAATLGEDHPLLAEPLHHVAVSLGSTGAAREALATALRAEAIARAHLRLTARGAPERQALRYAAERRSSLDLAIAIADELGDGASARAAWDALVRSRAVVLDEMATRHRLAARPASPADAAALRAYRVSSERLANLLWRGPGPDLEAYRRGVAELRAEREEAERSLAAHLAPLPEREGADPGYQAVRAALPEGAALVAFARVVDERDTGAEAARYVAFVLDGPADTPRLVSLGPAAAIETAIRRWRDELRPGRPEIDAAGHARAGSVVRELLWDPLGVDATGDRLVLVVPAGAVHLVSFAALPLPGGRFLAEADVLVHPLSSERDLLVDEIGPARGPLLAVGGVASRSRAVSATGGAGRSDDGADATCAPLAGRSFPELPGSRREAEAVASIWSGASARTGGRTRQLLGVEATEAAVRSGVAGSSVVHLATHGFFVGNDCAAEPSEGASPLRLSGLVLTPEPGSEERGAGDGMLLAEEAATLDLRDARWLVLSGCDTGVGGIQVDEGILGLARALRLAGAATLIMSLWPVEDRSAEVFMTSLYRARFDQGASTAASLRRAYRDALAETRRRRGHAHPLYWAPFVGSGDWR